MKILRVITSMNPKYGGPCQGIRNSIPALKNIGIENEVVCFDRSDAEFLKGDKFKIHAIGEANGSWGYNGTLVGWLNSNLEKYDAVIIHGLWQYHTHASLRTIIRFRKRRASPKVYVMPHGMLDPWFQRDKSRRIKALRNEIYWRLIEKKVVNSADGILFTCEQELLLARETFSGYVPKKEINIGYGIPHPPSIHSGMKKALAERPYWLFLSRIHPKKGVDLLIGAYKKLYSQTTNIPDLVIAGSLDSEYAKEMMKLAAGFDTIHFPGMLQKESKWGAFYGCEAFVLPSHQENFGIAVVEALACRKPVLISNQVNIWREIVHHQAGLIENDSLDGTTNLLTKWLTLSPIEKVRMGENAELTYTTYFSVDHAAVRLKKVLNIKS